MRGQKSATCLVLSLPEPLPDMVSVGLKRDLQALLAVSVRWLV